jgi:hypothetical protein
MKKNFLRFIKKKEKLKGKFFPLKNSPISAQRLPVWDTVSATSFLTGLWPYDSAVSITQGLENGNPAAKKLNNEQGTLNFEFRSKLFTSTFNPPRRIIIQYSIFSRKARKVYTKHAKYIIISGSL